MGEINTKIPVIIDPDPGADDAASICWVLANGFDVKALTIVSGNDCKEQCAINALKILEICGRTDIPIYIGEQSPPDSNSADGLQSLGGIHGGAGHPDRQFKQQSSCVYAEMIRIAKESVEPVTILALAPLTNVAMAVLLDPDFKNHVKQVLFMGSAVRVPGNDTCASGFNVDVDPKAAKLVYRSGIPVVQLGIDVCCKVRQTSEDLDMITRAGTNVTDFLLKTIQWTGEHAAINVKDVKGSARKMKIGAGDGSVGLHDLACTAYLIGPEWFKTRHLTVDMDASGFPQRFAAVVPELPGGQPNITWAYDVDARAAMDRWVKDMCAFDPKSNKVRC